MKIDIVNTPGSGASEELQVILTAIKDPVRRFLLDLLQVDDANAGDLAASAADTWGISTSRASQHLQVLARAGLVDVMTDGNTRTYRRAPGTAAPLAAWLRDVELA